MSDQQSSTTEARVVEVADRNAATVAPPTLEYRPPTPGGKRFFSGLIGGAMLVTSHMVALAVSLILLVALPLVVFIVVFVILFIIAATTDRDMGGPLFMPLGALLIIAFGLAMAAITCVANILTDTTRRLLRWPFWIPPVAIAGLSFIALSVFDIVHDRQSLLMGVRDALLPTLALTALFCVYWVPLSFTSAVLRFLKWTSKNTWQAFRQRRAARNVKPPAPGSP
jgi:hypothetical protein